MQDDITNIEIIATRLMGWRIVSNNQPTSRKQNILHVSQLPDWETDLNEAWEIVRALAEVDWHLEVERTGYLWFRSMTRYPRVGCCGLHPQAHRRHDVIKQNHTSSLLIADRRLPLQSLVLLLNWFSTTSKIDRHHMCRRLIRLFA